MMQNRRFPVREAAVSYQFFLYKFPESEIEHPVRTYYNTSMKHHTGSGRPILSGCARYSAERSLTMAALIAFYSRAGENYFGGAYRRIAVGNTEKAAELLADITGGELFHIRQAEPYSDVYQTCIAEAQQDLRSHARPEVLDLPEALDAYDEIYLGYPNYWGTMPMAVYTFLEHYDFTGKVIHPFCTHEGSGLSGTVRDIADAAPGAVVTKGVAIHGSAVDSAGPALERWVREVQ